MHDGWGPGAIRPAPRPQTELLRLILTGMVIGAVLGLVVAGVILVLIGVIS